MVVEVRSFENISGFLSSVEDEATRLKALLGDYMRRVELIKAKTEKHMKIQSIVSKVAKVKFPEGEVLDLKGVEVLINPSPKQELDVLLEAMQSVQSRINVLDSARKAVSVFQEAQSLDIPVEVVYRDGVPKTIILRM
ncbi:MAG: hypothetical protein QXQ29_02070 [Candidatus Bathyarchaeia archaeon]